MGDDFFKRRKGREGATLHRGKKRDGRDLGTPSQKPGYWSGLIK